ncbi:hypothetical protein ATHL_01997 [Anaerolinea thermolimosa]|uniref:phage tail tape measure protein n=1 Tax=Anaerolinea thermolimosa TaxID=229919 RepID=UPI000781A0EE|nr:phage tail tape measure protein [Anaerolinea thermolimosa]GAP07129.1 hypothetical protein ATHL_01997 [Anaerolinea thermolimosa]
MNLEKLVVPLEWAKSKFDSELRNLKSNLQDLTKKGLVLAGAGIGGFTTAAGVALNKTLEWGETLDSIQDHLNSTGEEAAGLALLFENVGGNADQLTSAMDKLTRGLWDSQGGLGETGKALESLGITLTGNNGEVKGAVQLFQEIADALSQMPEGLEKNTLLMELFGKSGVELGDALSLAANGGLQEFIDKADGMGLVFDQSQIDKTIEFNQKMGDLKGSLDGITAQFGILILQGLDPVITKFNTWLQDSNNQQKIKDLATALSTDLQGAIEGIGKAIDFAEKNQWVLDLTGGLLSLAGTLLVTGKILGVFGLTLAGLGAPVVALIGMIGVLIYTIIRFGQDAWNTLVMISALFRYYVGDLIRRNIETLINVIQGIGRAIQGVIGWIDRFINKLGSIKIPALLKPGSPTPFEMGLRGIGEALRELSSENLPAFQNELQIGLQKDLKITSSREDNDAILEAIQSSKIDEVKLAYALRSIVLRIP